LWVAVDHFDRVEIFHVDVDLARLGVDLRRLRLALERDGRDNFMIVVSITLADLPRPFIV
jgi:hypothetical protein